MNKTFLTVGLSFLTTLTSVSGQLSPGNTVERVRCALHSEAFERFSGDRADFFVQLPEHVILHSGAEVSLAWRRSTNSSSALAGVMISVNGQALPAGLEGKTPAKPEEPGFHVRTAVPERVLTPGWNRISLQLNAAVPAVPGQEARWELDHPQCYLEVVSERVPLFSELIRFPRSVAEEKLLRSAPATADLSNQRKPCVALLIPPQVRDVHLRACAILGARFGQLGYLSDSDCRVGSIQEWPKETAEGNGVVVGLAEELADVALLAKFAPDLSALRPGEGLLIEAIVGTFPRQRLWVVATGSDDAGLEKALLTLGSAAALATLAPSPALIETAPPWPAKLEVGNQPGAGVLTGLNQLDDLLVRDRSLRHAAFLLPLESSAAERQMLFDLALRLGRRLSDSPVLWPEACGYSAKVFPPASRLQGRSLLLLGALGQWKDALPAGTRLAIQMPAAHSDFVRLQGRSHPLATFEPSLMFVEMRPSPWSSQETLVAAGGWFGFAAPALKQMLTEGARAGKLFGNLCAMDANGRAAPYDTRHASVESFAERIHRRIPLGLGGEETSRRLAQEAIRAEQTARFNDAILCVCGGLLFCFVLCRLYFLWERERRRKRTVGEESPVGTTP